MDGQLHVDRPQIAILDFGSQYSHLIARRVRELHVFCELYSCLVKGEVLRKNQVIGIILSGGPNSVYASVGVMGDGRTYEFLCGIRLVSSTDYMTADWYRIDWEILARISTRIINEVQGINRCAYDCSSKPPATIEWE
ncbi:hypothetical protein NSK_006357 [Nannochloropsis salina CCMP1776]|uniref:GMP synthase C-terminal domain-containing protein n=1 Tax=Nannochloropsis salina CCMP1776 TaxID=1027361 RepID=A0A4D9CVW3_9STRA|nr:hypothetical protein NSK_006357 [Nannochloropsis salina CCMP1776]|eukprot:TFJ82237.1 hypothetical protein NSK_006357 [Nannochloropsis salina CCMP1776]